jgi:hypothetical protein
MYISDVLTQVKDKTVFETVPSETYQCNLIHNFNGDEIKAQKELRVENFGNVTEVGLHAKIYYIRDVHCFVA